MHHKVAVVIPCFRVKKFILGVISSLPQSVENIYAVDDACPEKTGDYVKEQCRDSRVQVLYNQENLGVGGAVIAGYKKAVEDGCSIIVKIDGDGQMDSEQIQNFLDPIMKTEADYAKGNRFYNPYFLRGMPKARLLGNALLSFATKLSSGYWDIFDPTNGFTAISASVLKRLPLDKINKRYFFESDMLFRLNIMRAVVMDIPVEAKYGEEESNLIISENIYPFFKGNMINFMKRIVYNYYLRNFSLASIQLIIGVLLMTFGAVFGAVYWHISLSDNQPATAGTVMVAALPIIVGFQMVMSFINYDVNTVPKRPLCQTLK